MRTIKVYNFFIFVLFTSFVLLYLSCENLSITKKLNALKRVEKELDKKKNRNILIIILFTAAGLALSFAIIRKKIYEVVRERNYKNRAAGKDDFFDNTKNFSRKYNKILSLSSDYLDNEFYKASDKNKSNVKNFSFLQKAVNDTQSRLHVTLSDYELRCILRELYRRMDVKYYDYMNNKYNKTKDNDLNSSFSVNKPSYKSKIPLPPEVINKNFMKALDIASKVKKQLKDDFLKTDDNNKSISPKPHDTKKLVNFVANNEGYELTKEQSDELCKYTHLTSLELYYEHMNKINPMLKKPKLKTYSMDMNVFSTFNKKNMQNHKNQIILGAENVEKHI
ncbi:early transcribed membrane protein [Plasmodium relictum]|uniref:Early transcribed membrane protein n=1 Tax=Plasmodium relictum TaxID=85471 RepID=A0A1J1H2Q7_PLARL|nr:early transcribed membrane protein [Plasmodium relictum]CRG99195.1 early transcribed membrane protein [Plasmodium relictum]